MERERAEDCREEEKTGEPPTYHSLSEKLEDLACYHRQMTSGCESVENYQAEEPEETPEISMSPADSIQEVLDEMEERCNRTREDLKQAVHMTKEEFEKTVNSLHQELDELIDKRKPMQSHPSPHDYVQRKQYKQVAGTLVMQDLEPPEHGDKKGGRNTDQPGHQEKLKPQDLNAQSSSSKVTPNIYLGPAKIWTLWFPTFQTFMKLPGNGSEHSKKKQLENFWLWVISKPYLQSAWEPPR